MTEKKEKKGISRLLQDENEIKLKNLSETILFIAKKEDYPVKNLEMEELTKDIMDMLDLSRDELSNREQIIVAKFLKVVFESNYYLKDTDENPIAFEDGDIF